MGSKIDRVGEENINTFGSKMVIIEYRNANDMDIYFSEYNWIAKNSAYKEFKNGKIKCPYERRVYGKGYLGEGKYNATENGKETKCYKVWKHMLERCYDEKLHGRELTYINCEIDEKWLCFQNFAEWYYENYYEVEEEKMCLDKDILYKNNKIYSSDNCVFVPHNINSLFTKRDKSRGKYPIGVYYHKQARKFKAQCSVYDFEENKTKRIHLGYYDSTEKAFQAYKQFKENNIKQVADYYKEQIPSKLYNALYNYKVEIDD